MRATTPLARLLEPSAVARVATRSTVTVGPGAAGSSKGYPLARAHTTARGTFGKGTVTVPRNVLPLQRHFCSATRPVREQAPQGGQSKGVPIGQVEQRLSLTFTCAVEDCGHRSTHEFSKRSYEKGIVLVQCPNCKNRHLIADHLSWFTEHPDEPKTVEQIVKEKGGRVRTGRKISDGTGEDQGETIEILSDTDAEESADSPSSASSP
ncbi:unnamed protein product [Parajaminaea phylloscopi]